MASIQTRLYRGELGYDFIGRRKTWYIASTVFVAVCLASMIFRGFNFGIEFEGGNSFQFPGSEQQLDQAEAAAQSSGVEVASAQVVGQDAILLRTAELSNETAAEVSAAVAQALDIDVTSISNSAVSAQWGGDITNKALQALAVFLVAVVIFIAIRFQPKMAVAALAALVNDLIVAAGVYSLVGFEVTPSTVIGLLTILGFSLYDTVVVFDKVDENTRGVLGGSRTTYSEAANLAVNQTLMRSINTSLIALLPVAGLLFVGAGLLGAGTLKDLALVLFVGLATGAYSSIFLATPILCDLKEREPAYAALRKRVEARKASGRGTDSEPAGPAKAARRSGKPAGRPAAGRPAAKRAGKPALRNSTAAKPTLSKPTATKPAPTTPAPTKAAPTTPKGATPALTKPTATDAAAGAGASRAVEQAAPSRGSSRFAPRAQSDSAEILRPSARRLRPSAASSGAGTSSEDPVDSAPDLDDELADTDTDTDTDTAIAESKSESDPASATHGVAGSTPVRPAAEARTGQRGRTGRPAGKSTSKRGGRPSGKRKR